MLRKSEGAAQVCAGVRREWAAKCNRRQEFVILGIVLLVVPTVLLIVFLIWLERRRR